MTLRINTNIAAMISHKNMLKTDNGLTASLEKLSSGLRINKAADDASGMAIADSLRSQGLALGQAIRNANDGIAIVQTADGALEESINIVNTIKPKPFRQHRTARQLNQEKPSSRILTGLWKSWTSLPRQLLLTIKNFCPVILPIKNSRSVPIPVKRSASLLEPANQPR